MNNYQDIPLIDADDAINRLGGNSSLYRILLNKFGDSNYVEEYQTHHQQNNTAEAGSAAHAVKGLAANLSLLRLRAVATDLDAAYKKGEDPGALPEILTAVYEETAAAVAAYLK